MKAFQAFQEAFQILDALSLSHCGSADGIDLQSTLCQPKRVHARFSWLLLQLGSWESAEMDLCRGSCLVIWLTSRTSRQRQQTPARRML